MPKMKTSFSNTVEAATPVSLFIRNPRDYKQVLQVQSKEGDHYKCFLVTGGTQSNPIVDNKKAIYVHQDSEIKQHMI